MLKCFRVEFNRVLILVEDHDLNYMRHTHKTEEKKQIRIAGKA